MIQQGGNAVDGAIAAAAVDDRRRAVQQRPRLRRVLHPLGRQAAARPQRLGPGAGGLDARVLPPQARRRRGPAAGARLGFGDGAGRRRRLGGAVRALRQAAVRRPARAGDRDRRARLRACRSIVQQKWVAGDAAARRDARLGRGLPAARPPARGRRALRLPGGGARPEGDRGDARRGVLRRRDRRRRGGARARPRRRDDGRATSPPSSPSGSSRSASTPTAIACTRSRPTARASPRWSRSASCATSTSSRCRSTAPSRSTCRSRR